MAELFRHSAFCAGPEGELPYEGSNRGNQRGSGRHGEKGRRAYFTGKPEPGCGAECAAGCLRGRKVPVREPQKLYKAGGTSKQELDRANVQLKDESAKLRDARTTVSRTQIRSALNGVVVRRSAEKGEFAEPGRELLAVADFDRREVEMLISPTIRGLIAPGMDVMVKAPWGGETMGKIFRMDPEADQATGFFRAIVRLPSECRLIPGDYVRMEVRMVRRDNTIAVPYEAILRENGNPFVFVVSGDVALHRDIRAGEGSGGYVEVPEGLSPGDRVVKTGAGSLYDGAKIVISNGSLPKPGDGKTASSKDTAAAPVSSGAK